MNTRLSRSHWDQSQSSGKPSSDKRQGGGSQEQVDSFEDYSDLQLGVHYLELWLDSRTKVTQVKSTGSVTSFTHDGSLTDSTDRGRTRRDEFRLQRRGGAGSGANRFGAEANDGDIQQRAKQHEFSGTVQLTLSVCLVLLLASFLCLLILLIHKSMARDIVELTPLELAFITVAELVVLLSLLSASILLIYGVCFESSEK